MLLEGWLLLITKSLFVSSTQLFGHLIIPEPQLRRMCALNKHSSRIYRVLDCELGAGNVAEVRHSPHRQTLEPTRTSMFCPGRFPQAGSRVCSIPPSPGLEALSEPSPNAANQAVPGCVREHQNVQLSCQGLSIAVTRQVGAAFI